MVVENVIALNVTDNDSYQTYRDKMTPILHEHGGSFGYDFHIAEVLKSETDAPINRVFTIHFPDQKTQDAFFSNEEYIKIRNEYFEPVVSDVTIIASYEKNK